MTNLRAAISKVLPKPKSRPPKAVKPVTIGTIALVASDDRFVLIEISSQSAAAAGAEAIAVGDGKETAKLRISEEKKHPFVIADILAGAPQVGDRVLSHQEPAATESQGSVP